MFERCQTLLHPELTPWWSYLLADGAHHKKTHSPTHPTFWKRLNTKRFTKFLFWPVITALIYLQEWVPSCSRTWVTIGKAECYMSLHTVPNHYDQCMLKGTWTTHSQKEYFEPLILCKKRTVVFLIYLARYRFYFYSGFFLSCKYFAIDRSICALA